MNDNRVLRHMAGLCAVMCAVLFAFGAHADAPARDFATYRPSAAATRIDPKEAPKIDADLSDAVWAKAPALSEFYQLEPQEGAPSSERTELRILYDENNLYFFVHAYDREPDKITAKVKARDGGIDIDDIIRIYIDPNSTRRDGYIFEINPLGSRREGLIQNNHDVLYEWDTLWEAKARIVADGWVAEAAIPMRSLSYARGRTDWGFDFFRLIRRKNERIRWSAIDIRIPSPDISRSGTLTGLHDLAEGFGLEAQLYAALKYHRIWDKPGDADRTFTPSGNIFYKVTPALTGTVTFNTDFSDTPLDDRKVNITRFSLFYPETRDFFLQDAAAFEFGGRGISDDPNGRPFFSRNIGLVNGSAVNLSYGGKLSGQIGDLSIGALSVKTGDSPFAEGQTLSAARLTMPVLDESKLGVIYTEGDPTGLTTNTVGGADFQYRNSHVLGGNSLMADFYYEKSHSSAVGDDDSFGLELNYPNEPWGGYFRFKQIGENFAPALGFVSRTGIRNYNGQAQHRSRFSDGAVRWSDVGVWWDVYTGLDNSMQSRYWGAWTNAYLNSGDYGLLEVWNDYEAVPVAFGLPKGVTVPAGRYDFNVYHGRIESAFSRPVSVVLDVQCCGFYGGTLLQTDTEITLKPNETFLITAEHIMDRIDLPTGKVDIHIASLDLAVNFTPDMQLRTQAQYDNISEGFGLSVRYRWEFAPGSELLIAAGDSATIGQGAYVSHESAISVRLGHTVRF